MKNKIYVMIPMALLLVIFPILAVADEEAPPTVEDQMIGLQTMCAEAAEAQAELQAEESLFIRLGGYDQILALTTEIVRLHSINEQIKRTLDGVDYDLLAKHVADFMAAGTGGDVEYTGRDLPSSHKHLNLSDADFLSAGGDIITAMQSMEYGQEEIDEVICILVSLKDQVVFE